MHDASELVLPAAARALDDRSRRTTTPCGDGVMAWREWGAGEPVVLLHGGSGSWTHWLRNIEPLAARHRVLAPDLPGLGESSPPPRRFDWNDLQGSVVHVADVTAAGLATQVDTPVHLVGFSFGSITAAWLTVRRPALVRSLTVVGGASMGMPWLGIDGELYGVDPHDDETTLLDQQAHNLALMMLAQRERIDRDTAALQLHNARRARLRSHPLADADVLRNAIALVDRDLHMVWGDRDIYALPDLAGRIAYVRHHHPRCGVDVLAGGGHWVMYECADAFNAALAARLRRPRAADPEASPRGG